MDEVKIREEVVVRKVYETATHKFTISKDTLERMEEREDYIQRIGTLIQKSMRQVVDNSSGGAWDSSVDLIFTAITKQKTLRGVQNEN